MSVTVRAIPATKKELSRYVQFGIDLYKGNPYFVPPLIFDDVNTLLPEKNPAFDFSEAQSFMAYRDGKPAGRITAIINRMLNEKTGRKEARFGFVDFVDDPEVSGALFKAAEDWSRERGMDDIIGPMGFSDMDHEGMLVEGFDEMGTMATIYNYPYYPAHMERMGYRKDTDWIEFRITIPERLPEKMERIAEIVLNKYDLRIKKFTSAKKIKEQYGEALFKLINEAYAELYGYSPLTDKQISYYIDMYLGFLKLDYVSIVVDRDDNLIGVGISMPSMTKALQKSQGKLFPFGWWHMLKALKGHNDVVDLMLIAVRPEYQSKGVNSLFFYDLCNLFIRDGVKYAETNLELEENIHVQSQWEYFERRQHRRRRAYRKSL
ncbi:N-acetyltransferase [uncultured Duncaniella sp.]|uniref:N-acetyltransferase n=1 Tax=uncultured Duncaniella sp. TaxID=2768039 RepID=UPI0025D891ED|nr:N-acetyltransferase [uncultured Duncaniella sp.]